MRSPLAKLGRRILMARLERLEHGRLTIREGGGATVFGAAGGTSATIDLHDAPDFFASALLGGHVGAAEAYLRGSWESDDLTSVVRVLLRNRELLDAMETGLARLTRPARALLHARHRNTRTGSRRNIAAHYDLGNDFFSVFLDDTMTYSCGVFETPESTLREASLEKYDRICRKLDLVPGDRVVEIGAGWGGFAIHAASTYGCRVTTTTISSRQHAFATERVRALGLSDRVQVLTRDYRDLEGRYDKLVSIEMIEAVGHEFYPLYFARCAELLEPHGLAAIQAITIQDWYYEAARRRVDFIKRYVFPGGCVPCVSALCTAAAPTDLRLVDLESIGPHYAETLRRWRERFHAGWQEIRSRGYPEFLRRLWHFYFCYCEGGFAEGVLGDVQLLFAKPRAATPNATRGVAAATEAWRTSTERARVAEAS